jgi:UPF0755 protein
MENLPSSNEQAFDLYTYRKKIPVLCVVILFLFFVFIFAYFLFFSAPRNFQSGTIVNIKEGSSLGSISSNLTTNNIIRSKFIFKVFVVILGGEKSLASGDYLFEEEIPVFLVAKRLARGEHHLAPIKVTIPEGFNNLNIAEIFALKLPNFDKNRFIKNASAQEGYLFPDTYFFLTTDTDLEVVAIMSDNFDKKIKSFSPQISLSGKTQEEIIAMASILEEEASGDADRELISGILWKRININMPLQVDADKSTYKIKGLPKNPISNPGLKAIQASLHPKSSSYLYYLHDKDGNVHYAKNFAEHQINIRKYLVQ